MTTTTATGLDPAEQYAADRNRLWVTATAALTAAAKLTHPTGHQLDFADFLADALAAGTLTGHAAGIDPDPDPSDQSLLDHLAEVWPLTEEGPVDKVWWDDLAIRLAETFPGLYSGWTGKQVSTAAKPHGLNSGQVKRTIDGRQLNRRGLTHTDLAAALRARDTEDGGGQLDQADGWPQLPAPEDTDTERTDLR